MPFKLGATEPPYVARIDVGGGLPFLWDLYEYVPSGAKWTRRKLGSGDNTSPTAMLAALTSNSVLTWSVVTIVNGAETVPVTVRAELQDRAHVVLPAVTQQTEVTSAQPGFFLSVEVQT